MNNIYDFILILNEAQKAEEEGIKKEKEEQAEREAVQADMKNHPVRFIEVVENKWRLDGFGTIAMHDITLKNTSEVDYKDIRIITTYSSPSGTELSTAVETIILAFIKNLSSRGLRDFSKKLFFRCSLSHR